MWIEQVEATAFGPLAGETLALAPGLTVVHGPNESGKSTWHAAIEAALCGRRRGPGRTKAEQAFAERHRPWSGEGWAVAATVRLADGRRIELRHDLEGKADCRATDLALGRDLTGELTVGGAPDAALLLGLTRATVPATILVRQADVLGVLDDPSLLQDVLQRAAATSADERTAAEALDRIDAFRRERVGSRRAGSTKPLRQAEDEVAAAERCLTTARAAREEYEQLVIAVEDAARAEQQAATEVQQLQAAREEQSLDAVTRRLERARTLAAALPADEAVGAHPDGDTRVAADVTEAARRWQRACHAAELHHEWRPHTDQRAVTGEGPLASRAPLRRRPWPGRRWPVVAGVAAVAALAAAGSVSAGRPTLSLALTGLSVLAALLAARAARPRSERTAGTQAGHRRGPQEATSAAQHQHEQQAAWTERALELEAAASAAASALVDALAARGGTVHADADPSAALAAYEQACAKRAAEVAAWSAELTSVLDGITLDDLTAEAARRRDRLASARTDGDAPLPVAAASELDERLAAAEAAWRAAAGEVAERRGQARAHLRALPDVVTAEERVAAATAERDRLLRLEATLNRTTELLEAARDHVHRDLAAALQSTLERWLPTATGGRYYRAAVDPATLAVLLRDADGRWRAATTLSQGTAEQVYLLLRLAFAEHLVTTDEPAPLVLDDVTVQCDPGRTRAICGLLHTVSRDRQVVLFTQEADVVAWAEATLTGRDATVALVPHHDAAAEAAADPSNRRSFAAS